MLPNLRFLICGVLFCFLLFAVTGAGVMLPDARTRVGEMPEIGRPMMQRSIAEAPAQAQFYMTTAARRTDELERLRERASLEVASAPAQPEPEPGLPKLAVTANLGPDGMTPDGVIGEDGEAAVQVTRAGTVHNDGPEEGAGPQVAALAPASADDGGETVPRLVNVPLPPPRPAFLGFHRRVRLVHRRRRVVMPPDTPAQGLPAQGMPPAQGIMPLQGVPSQNWSAQGVPAGTTAVEAARRQ